MRQEPTESQALASLIISVEHGADSDIDHVKAAVSRTFDKLNVHLSSRIGSGGYRALLGRALALAAADDPWIASVRIDQNSNLEGIDDITSIDQMLPGFLNMLERFIGLLESFIGIELTIRLIHGAWPDAVPVNLLGMQGESNE